MALEFLQTPDGELRTVEVKIDLPGYIATLVEQKRVQGQQAQDQLGSAPLLRRKVWEARRANLEAEQARMDLLVNFSENVANPQTHQATLQTALRIVGIQAERLDQSVHYRMLLASGQIDEERLSLHRDREMARLAMRQIMDLMLGVA